MSSILSSLGGGGAPQAGPGGPPPGVAPSIQLGGSGPQGPQKSDGDWETDLRNALAALRALEADAQDDQEGSVVAQCISHLRKLTAQRQAGAESASGVTPALKAMGRSYQ